MHNKNREDKLGNKQQPVQGAGYQKKDRQSPEGQDQQQLRSSRGESIQGQGTVAGSTGTGNQVNNKK